MIRNFNKLEAEFLINVSVRNSNYQELLTKLKESKTNIMPMELNRLEMKMKNLNYTTGNMKQEMK